MKVGLIGFGSIGQRHYANLQKYTTDVVILSQRKDLPVAKTARTWSEFKKHGPFEIIFITNETFKHIPTLSKCLALKPKAIFMEKPLSHNLSGLSRLPELLRKSSVSLWVGYNFHFFKPFLRIKEILKSGKIGKIYFFRVAIGQDLRTWRKRDYRENYSGSKRQGGGVVLDLVHDINYPAWLLDDELILQSALVKKISDLHIDTEDCAETILTSKRRGVIVTVHQDYLRVPRKQTLEIGGDKGSLEWDSISNIITMQTTDKIFHETIISDRNEMFISELKFFMGEIKKKVFFTNIDEAIHDMEIISYVKKYGKK